MAPSTQRSHGQLSLLVTMRYDFVLFPNEWLKLFLPMAVLDRLFGG